MNAYHCTINEVLTFYFQVSLTQFLYKIRLYSKKNLEN